MRVMMWVRARAPARYRKKAMMTMMTMIVGKMTDGRTPVVLASESGRPTMLEVVLQGDLRVHGAPARRVPVTGGRRC